MEKSVGGFRTGCAVGFGTCGPGLPGKDGSVGDSGGDGLDAAG
jgi:hypothetical protein